jgi:hypothetical protein
LAIVSIPLSAKHYRAMLLFVFVHCFLYILSGFFLKQFHYGFNFAASGLQYFHNFSLLEVIQQAIYPFQPLLFPAQ